MNAPRSGCPINLSLVAMSQYSTSPACIWSVPPPSRDACAKDAATFGSYAGATAEIIPPSA